MANPQVALLFMIPGVTETLRVNGVGELTGDEQLRQLWDVGGRHPRAVLRVFVREAFLHCGKALLRARLWEAAADAPRNQLPPLGYRLKDHVAVRDTAEQLDAAIRDAYEHGLY